MEKWRTLGATIIELDFQPFLDAATLLYQGPWVAERYIATSTFIQDKPEAMHPVVRTIIEAGNSYGSTDTFNAFYKLQGLKKLADAQLSTVDFILTPTYGRQYSINEVLADPIRLNSELGYYTNYMNLLDYSAIALPAGIALRGIPFGITLVADKFEDQYLLAWARLWQEANKSKLGNTDLINSSAETVPYKRQDKIDVVVCGAHLLGLPLNWQLVERGATLVDTTKSAPHYKLYALADGKRPAMVRDDKHGGAIEIEVWQIPTQHFGSFVANIPAPLGIGKVELEDGSWKCGFICDAYGLEGAKDITTYGGWRSYLGQAPSESP